jgi:hypothetical protein
MFLSVKSDYKLHSTAWTNCADEDNNKLISFSSTKGAYCIFHNAGKIEDLHSPFKSTILCIKNAISGYTSGHHFERRYDEVQKLVSKNWRKVSDFILCIDLITYT